MPETYLCPFCEHEAVVGKSCPHCAKSAKPKKVVKKEPKSREQDKSADGLDLPDEDFDYDEFVKREFSKLPHHGVGRTIWWWILGVGILITLFAQMLGVF